MARNVVVENYNREYLAERIEQGVLKEVDGNKVFEFTGISANGDISGNRYDYFVESGLITKTTDSGRVTVFGDVSKSSNARGYVNVEMLVPYDGIIHCNTSEENVVTVLAYDKEGLKEYPVAVQHTAYIHNVASLIEAVLRGVNIEFLGNGNHKDGCKIHNWLSNIEDVSVRENVIHGIVVNSMFKYTEKAFGVGVASNKTKKFKYLEQPVSARWIMEYLDLEEEFREELKRVRTKPIVAGQKMPRTMDKAILSRFVIWLINKGYWN